MVIWLKNIVYQGVLLVGKCSCAFLCSHDHFTKDASTIGVETFIVLEDPFGVREVMKGTFIVLDGPAEVSEGIIVSLEGHTPMVIVLGFSCPMDVPPKPLDVVISSKALTRDDHF